MKQPPPAKNRDLHGNVPDDSPVALVLIDMISDFGATTLILTGVTGDMCVLLTAADAFLRDLHLVVPSDCVASIDAAENRRALAYMKRALDADVRPSSTLDFERLRRLRAA